MPEDFIFDPATMNWESIRTHTEVEVHHLMDHGDPDRFPLLSRDWEDIDCGVQACINNRLGKCGVPSLCKIGDDGKCQGFKTSCKSKTVLEEAIDEAIEQCNRDEETEE